MSSDRTDPPSATQRESTPPQVRLEMSARDIGRGYVDGGWWPHSYDAATEFPPLIAALRTRIGRVERIGYDMDLWHSATRKLIHDGEVVRCEGFHTAFAHTVSVISILGQQVSVLVVPPTTDNGTAEAALHAASGLASVHTLADILARMSAAVATSDSPALPQRTPRAVADRHPDVQAASRVA
jgi:hypothetical protein